MGGAGTLRILPLPALRSTFPIKGKDLVVAFSRLASHPQCPSSHGDRAAVIRGTSARPVDHPGALAEARRPAGWMRSPGSRLCRDRGMTVGEGWLPLARKQNQANFAHILAVAHQAIRAFHTLDIAGHFAPLGAQGVDVGVGEAFGGEEGEFGVLAGDVGGVVEVGEGGEPVAEAGRHVAVGGRGEEHDLVGGVLVLETDLAITGDQGERGPDAAILAADRDRLGDQSAVRVVAPMGHGDMVAIVRGRGRRAFLGQGRCGEGGQGGEAAEKCACGRCHEDPLSVGSS